MARAPNFTAGVAEILSATREAGERDWEIEKSITSGRSWRPMAASPTSADGRNSACRGRSCRARWDWLNGEDPAMVQRVTSKVWAMEKLDLAELRRAANER